MESKLKSVALKEFRCVCTRYDKLDRMFAAFIWLACICIALRSVNTL
jgi:transposase